MNKIGSNKAEEILGKLGQMMNHRVNFENQWNEIAERIIPSHVNTFDMSGITTPGQKNTDKIFDSTASIALSRFSAIVDSLLTPMNQKWHRLSSSNPYINRDRSVRLWFDEVTDILFRYRYYPRANFVSQNQQNFSSLGAYGSGVLFTDRLKDEMGLRYRNIHLGEVYFAENHQGLVDKAVRRFRLTYRQAEQMFGAELPEELKVKGRSSPEEETFFVHCVETNEDYDPTRVDYAGMKFASYYVSEVGKKVVGRGGYQTFPYAISRYMQGPNEVYGRSIAMDVLPTIKMLNEMKKTMIKQGHRAVDPILLVHDDGILDSLSLVPGSAVSGGISADGRSLVGTLPFGNVQLSREMMLDERQTINDSFLVTLFQIMVETPNMTATEVMERTREKGMLLTPTVGRQQSEYLGPLIERELDLLSQMNLIPPMPPLLLEAQGEYTVVYDSPLSRAQRAEEASGLMRTVESALQVVNVTQNPEPLDHFNWDVIIPKIGYINGVPEEFMRPQEEVQKIREGRSQAAETQEAIQAAPAAAAMMKAQ